MNLRAAFIVALILGSISLVFIPRDGLRADENSGTNINSGATSSIAWNDGIGWIDFHTPHTAKVRGTRLEGYASSSFGDVSLDCATTSAGNICSTSNYGVCNGPGSHSTDGLCANGDSSGSLTGYAWNDSVGWISFYCDQTSHGATSSGCSASNYQVTIDANGDFSGFAWNDAVGWISFNSTNDNSSTTYKVNTDWRATSTIGYVFSSIVDTAGSSTLQSITWQGSQPSNTSVDFQIAVATSSNGPWNYFGPQGNANAYFGTACPNVGSANPGAGPDAPICIDKTRTANYRYMRYKVRLISDLNQTKTPRITGITLNWNR